MLLQNITYLGLVNPLFKVPVQFYMIIHTGQKIKIVPGYVEDHTLKAFGDSVVMTEPFQFDLIRTQPNIETKGPEGATKFNNLFANLVNNIRVSAEVSS